MEMDPEPIWGHVSLAGTKRGPKKKTHTPGIQTRKWWHTLRGWRSQPLREVYKGSITFRALYSSILFPRQDARRTDCTPPSKAALPSSSYATAKKGFS